MKKLATLALILIYLNVNSQSQIHASAGYKAIEIGYTYQNEEFLNFGFSASVVDAGTVEKRANKNDVNRNIHDFESDVVPALFGEVGGAFDSITITGKIGTAYLDQRINSIQEKQKLYLAVGMRFGLKVSENVQINAGYDNINSALAGLTFNFN